MQLQQQQLLLQQFATRSQAGNYTPVQGSGFAPPSVYPVYGYNPIHLSMQMQSPIFAPTGAPRYEDPDPEDPGMIKQSN